MALIQEPLISTTHPSTIQHQKVPVRMSPYEVITKATNQELLYSKVYTSICTHTHTVYRQQTASSNDIIPTTQTRSSTGSKYKTDKKFERGEFYKIEREYP